MEAAHNPWLHRFNQIPSPRPFVTVDVSDNGGDESDESDESDDEILTITRQEFDQATSLPSQTRLPKPTRPHSEISDGQFRRGLSTNKRLRLGVQTVESASNQQPALSDASNPFDYGREVRNQRSMGLDLARIGLQDPIFTPSSRPLHPNPVSDDLSLANTLLKSQHGSGQEPPSYCDPVWGVTMYRGPGYEKFPIVLGDVKEHRDFCKEWELLRVVEPQRGPTRFHGTGMIAEQRSIESDPESCEAILTDNERLLSSRWAEQCLAIVLDVFPNAARHFVLRQILDHPLRPQPNVKNHLPSTGMADVANYIITRLAEMVDYPKEPKVRKPEEEPSDGSGTTIDWDKNAPKDDSYLADGVALLHREFPYVPTINIFRKIVDNKSIFHTFCHLQNLESRYHKLEASKRPYRRLHAPRVALEKKYQLMGRPGALHNPSRINELQAAKQHWFREQNKISTQQENAAAEDRNLEHHKATGALAECQCCFDSEIPLNRVVGCQAEVSHFFCFGCISSLAESQVGLMKYEMTCMDGSGCKAELSPHGVAKATNTKTYDRLQLNRQQAEIIAAEIEGLAQCPFCDFKAICDAVDAEPIFHCQNPDCARSSCRRCDSDSHVPKTCEEVREAEINNLTVRHRVEEARSEAVMRKCPKCKVKIIKDQGCNKLVCSQCRVILCYVCQADLTSLGHQAYSHFSDAKCPLHDNPGLNRHAHEAEVAEDEVIKKAKEEDSTIDESKLRLGRDDANGLDARPPGNTGRNTMVMAQQPYARLPGDVQQHRLEMMTLRKNLLNERRRASLALLQNNATRKYGQNAGLLNLMNYGTRPQIWRNVNPGQRLGQRADQTPGQQPGQQPDQLLVPPPFPRTNTPNMMQQPHQPGPAWGRTQPEMDLTMNYRTRQMAPDMWSFGSMAWLETPIPTMPHFGTNTGNPSATPFRDFVDFSIAPENNMIPMQAHLLFPTAGAARQRVHGFLGNADANANTNMAGGSTPPLLP
ncbi:hypothetical protein B0A52_08181 [Exophiala mesophila]|uniref:RING-type domain-containing protein n=1 Tax=Exophiala mesophila TaxID=212818 RepID=A0A438MV71_EXOME|nr:hypothetical protein B0A52_08181 [Exophiala mesophila]